LGLFYNLKRLHLEENKVQLKLLSDLLGKARGRRNLRGGEREEGGIGQEGQNSWERGKERERRRRGH
jgi:hypothetical protein